MNTKKITSWIVGGALVLASAMACEPPKTTADPNLTHSAAPKKATKPSSSSAPATTQPETASTPDDGLETVTYRISGSADSAMITYTTPSGQEQHTKSLPWSRKLKVSAGDFLSISAQNQGEGGTIVCEILLNGQVLKRSKSSGAYAIASCDGAVGY